MHKVRGLRTQTDEFTALHKLMQQSCIRDPGKIFIADKAAPRVADLFRTLGLVFSMSRQSVGTVSPVESL